MVEDDSLICLLLEDMLLELGCQVVGTAADVTRAIDLAQREESVDVAILDVNLGGRQVFPVAEILAERGVPFCSRPAWGRTGCPTAGWAIAPCRNR